MKIIFDHNHGHVIDNRVFCEAFVIPEGESEDFLLENGWLPSVQPPIYWYQSQSVRINSEKVFLNKKQLKTFSKVECEYLDYKGQKEIDEYFFNFFQIRDLDMVDFYNKNSEYFKLKVLCVKIDSQIVGYTRFTEFENCILGFESSYRIDLPKHSLGINSILILSEYGKINDKKFLYIYEGYKDLFPHKLQITGSEHWEGEKWVSENI